MTKPTFTTTREASDLLVVDISGAMDAIAMEVALDTLVPVVRGMHHGSVLMRAKGVEWPTLGAIGVELRHWPQLMAMIEKVDRVALLTDQVWVKALASMESALIPGMVIRSFAPDQEDAARTWLMRSEV